MDGRGNPGLAQGISSAPRGLLPPAAWGVIARRLDLSPRQLSIVQAILDGHSERGIASRLNISCHTVHTHVERLYRKLGVSRRTELVLRVVREYLSTPPD